MEKFPSHSGRGKKHMGVQPAHIRRAQLEGRTDYLSEAGRRGGLRAAQTRKERLDARAAEKVRATDIETLYADRLLEPETQEDEETRRRSQTGEDVVPPSLHE